MSGTVPVSVLAALKPIVRTLALLLLASLLAACTPSSTAPTTMLPRPDGSGLVALYAIGGRSVRVLVVRPPSIVLAHESFLAADQSIRGVHWEARGLAIDTDTARYDLDTQTWALVARTIGSDGMATARPRERR